MFGPGRRMSRRTARCWRAAPRRQMAWQDQGGYEDEGYDEPAPAAPAAPQESDYLAELQKLSELKAAGVINDEEFEAKKKQLLEDLSA